MAGVAAVEEVGKRLVMLALPAELVLLKVVNPRKRLTIVALPPLLLPTKSVSPPLRLVMAIELADVPSKKVVRPEKKPPLKSLRIEVMPLVLALTMSNVPKLVTAPTMLAAWVASPSCSAPQSQMVVPPL